MFGKSLTYSIIIAGMALTGCTNESCRLSKEPSTQVEHPIDTIITELEVSDNIQLKFYPSDSARLYVRTNKNWQQDIKVQQNENKLILQNNNACRMTNGWKSHIEIELHLPQLKLIKRSGIGSTEFMDTLVQDSLFIDASESFGDVEVLFQGDYLSVIQHSDPTDFFLKGKSESAYFYTGGNGFFHAKDFSVNHLHVDHNGMGDMNLQVDSTFKAQLRSSGNIYFAGSPSFIDTLNTGSGKIRRD